MEKIRLGSENIKALFLGSTQINKLAIGDKIITDKVDYYYTVEPLNTVDFGWYGEDLFWIHNLFYTKIEKYVNDVCVDSYRSSTPPILISVDWDTDFFQWNTRIENNMLRIEVSPTNPENIEVSISINISPGETPGNNMTSILCEKYQS